MFRFVFYSLLLCLLGLSGWVVHHSAADATWISRQLYPLEALLASTNVQCEGPQQQMLKNALVTARQQGSLRSQVAYLSPQGDLSLCASAPWQKSADDSARYRYASLTKIFTAQAVLNFMAQQQLPLNTTLGHFIAEVEQAEDKNWQQVTIEQLLTHSAGLDRLRSYDPMTRHAVTPWCPNDLSQLQHVKLDFEPGSNYGYSNLTYCLLGVVLEKLSGQPFEQALEATLQVQDFGMRFIDGPYLADEVQYDFRHAGFYSDNYYRYLDFPALASSAGLSGTAKGLMQWLATQQQAGQLTVSQRVWPDNCDISQKRACYGYALFPYRKQGSDLLVQVQQGYVFGASSSLIFDEHGGVFVWLGNGSAPKGSASDNMLDAMYELLAAHYE